MDFCYCIYVGLYTFNDNQNEGLLYLTYRYAPTAFNNYKHAFYVKAIINDELQKKVIFNMP